ncbi:M3 family oligoendopeptidase [Geminicoccaceae bacterium SYSU G07066]|uniref:M3 family oligoendopeptidase n=1 Tax=Benzoatithermus flavus TaxID=3108223 RepID=A0ABU8XWL6_9PROT
MVTGEAPGSLAPAEQGPAWSLGDLYASPEDPRIEADLLAADHEAGELEATYKGRLPELDGDGLAALLERYEALEDRIGRVASYAQLLFAANRDDAEIGRFYQGIQERVTAIGTKLLFVTLELNKLDDAPLAEKIEASNRLRRLEPWIEVVRSFRPHQLSDEVERTLHEKHVTGRSAWVRLFDETMAGLRFPLDGKELTSAEIFDLLSAKDRSLRERAASSISGVLEKNIRLFSRIMNTLVKDKQIEDDWRKFPRPISSRNLANQVEDEVVDALISAVRAAYPRISHRYYTLKARWLGLDRLEFWDRNAPLPEDVDTRRPWSEARGIVLDAYRRFSPTLADILTRFFEGSWIDAQLRPGKDSGAFCHPTVPSVHPYVLMNYQGRNRDVMTLAHELGHGVHQVLAARQGPLMASTPLTLAETASVFGEQLTFQALLAEETDPARRRVLLAAKIEDKINTVVRQIAFCEFERQVHDARKAAELTTDDLCRIWMGVQTESLGPAFRFRDDYRFYWSYIPHFIHVPFYVYAYAFGDCLVSSLYAVYEENPEGFEPRYLDLLRAGGTLRHKELLAPFGLDASDPGFWAKGLGLLEGLIDQLEATLPERA